MAKEGLSDSMNMLNGNWKSISDRGARRRITHTGIRDIRVLQSFDPSIGDIADRLVRQTAQTMNATPDYQRQDRVQHQFDSMYNAARSKTR